MSSPDNPDFSHYQNVLEDAIWNHRGDVDLYTQTLADRIQVEKAHISFFRSQRGNKWSIADGYYPDSLIDEHGIFHSRTRTLSDPLSTLEQAWAKQINTHLERRDPGDKPVIALDFGGGFALSLMRLGAHESFRQPVENGSLILAATNLGYVPTDIPDNSGYTGVARDLKEGGEQGYNAPATDERLDFTQNNQHRVQYLDSDFFTLGSQAVRAISGESLPLTSSIAVINEHQALGHSHIPDLGIGVLSSLLIPNGHFFLATKNGRYLERPTLSTVTMPDGRIVTTDKLGDHPYTQQRRSALELGVQAAHRFGLELIDQGSTYAPFVFRKC